MILNHLEWLEYIFLKKINCKLVIFVNILNGGAGAGIQCSTEWERCM